MSDGPGMRTLRFVDAVREATEICMERDADVHIMGEGVPDPKGIFNTTTGLEQRFGPERVLDLPLSEEGFTGMAVGAAITGTRPVITHQRVDFSLLSLNQIVNNAAKWHYMFDGKMRAPITIRMAVGMGWGQGAQHSQSLHSWFAHVPGLKVALPATPHDAKGMLIAAIEDDAPTIFLEHRWLHNTTGHVPEGHYTVPLGEARIARPGDDVTVVASSHMVIESLKAAQGLAPQGLDIEVVDMRTARPLDAATILDSVAKTGHLVVADGDWRHCGLASEVLATVAEEGFDLLDAAPLRITWPDVPAPSSPALAEHFYPRATDIGRAALHVTGHDETDINLDFADPDLPHDVPDPNFMGPF